MGYVCDYCVKKNKNPKIKIKKKTNRKSKDSVLKVRTPNKRYYTEGELFIEGKVNLILFTYN